MRAFLLANEGEFALGIAVFLLIVVAGILLSTAIKNKTLDSQSKTKGAKFEGQIKVTVNKPYIPADGFLFFNALNRALPYEYIAFPKVSVSSVLKPIGDASSFGSIASKFVDFCIFKKETMEPVAVVDLINRNATIGDIMRQEAAITNTLKSVNIPTLEFVVQDRYNEKEILATFLDSQDPYTIALLRKGKDPKDFDGKKN